MESYSTSCSSSNKSSYTSQNTKKANGSMKHAQYPFQSKHSWLHSVRKSPAKTWKKALIAPMIPTPLKVYTVDPINFKELVQFLTCAPQFVPPQPDLHNLPQSTNHTTRTTANIDTVPSNNWYQYFRAEYFGKNYDQEEEAKIHRDNVPLTPVSDGYSWEGVFSRPATPIQVRHVTIYSISGFQPELDFIKFLLLYSPVLEKIIVKPHVNAGVELLTELVRFKRASGEAEVIYDIQKKRQKKLFMTRKTVHNDLHYPQIL